MIKKILLTLTADDRDGICQGVVYMKTSEFSKAEIDAFDKANIPPGVNSWIRIAADTIPAIPGATDLAAWMTTRGETKFFVVGCRYAFGASTMPARFYGTLEGSRLFDKVGLDKVEKSFKAAAPKPVAQAATYTPPPPPPVQVNTVEEWRALAPGTRYRDGLGNIAIRGNNMSPSPTYPTHPLPVPQDNSWKHPYIVDTPDLASGWAIYAQLPHGTWILDSFGNVTQKP
jgi:hypothetical protein